MNCGNRFQCGLTKSSRHPFKPDKPSNTILHHENQIRLNELLKAREEIDKQYLTPTTLSQPIENTVHRPQISDTIFTPWKVPSTNDYQTKTK